MFRFISTGCPKSAQLMEISYHLICLPHVLKLKVFKKVWLRLILIAGPEIAVAVQKIFAAAEVPIAWEPVDVAPIRNADGTMGIPQVINSVHVFLLYFSRFCP